VALLVACRVSQDGHQPVAAGGDGVVCEVDGDPGPGRHDGLADTFKQFVFAELGPDAVIVHNQYQNYDSTQIGVLHHQLCLAHVLRDLKTAAELYPEHLWPTQLAAEIRELIHRANTARARGAKALTGDVLDIPVRGLCSAVAMGLRDTTHLDDHRPGARKSRLLLEEFRQREADFLRFTGDLRIPPTSNQAERDLRPSKIQEKISGRLTSIDRTKDRYLIRGVLSTAVKHLTNPMAVLRDVFRGKTWLPPAATVSSPDYPDPPAADHHSPDVTPHPKPSRSALQLNVWSARSTSSRSRQPIGSWTT
jgi:hypothetical protein